jgi:eukaryotic-like serine/threonine-protein kinase
MGIAGGTLLGPYQVTDAIGAGGMGEVYRALDTRLDRTVAIKVLPDHLSSDPLRRERFQREAKTISGFSHPNICSLYDVGEQNGAHYLVLEYIEGESLAARLRKGPLPIAEALKIGAEIASALDAAHRHGIIHRDLKPANVMLTRNGAKLLDFGLAKPVVMTAAAGEATLAKSLTEEGTIVGTFQYMSPEQLEGSEADARSDIFALGTMLYEMATGKPAFNGKTRVSLIASILSSEPKPMGELAPLTPPSFEHLVRTCLAKDPDDRFQSAHDLLLQLRWIADAGSQVGVAPMLARRHRIKFRAGWAIAALTTAALLVTATVWLLRPAPAPPPAVRAFLQPPKGSSFSIAQLAVSPDGTKLVYSQAGGTSPRLFIQSLASGVAQPLSDYATAGFSFFSPDSKSVGFCDGDNLRKADIAGGQILSIAATAGCVGGSWNQQGEIVVADDKGVEQVSAGGGTPSVVLPADKSTKFQFPAFLPDGRHFLVSVERQGTGTPSGSDDFSIGIGDLKAHTYKILLDLGVSSFPVGIPDAQYADGYVVFKNQNNLMARPFDPEKGAFTGDNIALGPLGGLFTVSRAGVLVLFGPGESAKTELRWMGRSGQQFGHFGEPHEYDNVRISPDGSRVAYQLFDNNAATAGVLWVYDIKRDVSARITFDKGVSDDRPVWSPDGKYLLFNRYGDNSMRRVLSSGLGGEEVVLEHAYPDDWSSDGRYIAYDTGNPAQIGILELTPEKKSHLLLNVNSSNHDARFSPDAKFLAYTSDESGQSEIYVVPFPSLTQKWRVSTEGGTRATWRRDGKELYYLSPDLKLMAVPVTRVGDNLTFGKPEALFQGPFQVTGNGVGRPYDVTSDGQKFIVNAVVETTPQPMTIITNWTSLAKK